MFRQELYIKAYNVVLKENKDMEELIDLTHTIIDMLPVYPGDDATRLFHTKKLDRDGYCYHRLETGMHSGTHIDFPMHLVESSKYASDFPLHNFIGKGCILDVRNLPVIKMKTDYTDKISENSILLLFTGQNEKFGSEEYFSNTPVIDEEFAFMLIEKKIKILGIDSPSPDRFPFMVHKLLLNNGIPIIENLTNLELLLDKANFEVIAFPLKIRADASIIRAVAKIMRE